MHRAIDDETRHIKLCDTLARAYGWSQPPSPPTPHHPIGPAGVSQGDRLLYEMVAFCCITETLNASMLLTIHRRVIATDIKDAIHTILKDEINHSKVGWAYLEYRRSQGDGDALSAWLPRMFKGAGVDEVHTPDSGGRDSDRMADYGELSFAMRVQIFAAAVRDVIFPGLERHGIDTARSRTWLEQFQAPTQAPDSPT